MKILVTGGAGFIGSHVVDLLINEKHDVVIIDNLSGGKRENLNLKARFYNQDLNNHPEIEKILEKEKPEVVYHLAAQIDVRKSIEKPIFDARENIINTLNLLDCCIKNKVKHFIFSSTGGAIYGDTKEIPTSEEHLENPISPYGVAKLAIEKYLHFYKKTHGLKFTCLRYGNVYGPRQDSKGEAGVVSIFLNSMFSGQNPLIFGGIQTRDFVYVEDIARANLLALKDEEGRIFNIGTSKETDIIEIFNKLNRYFNFKFVPEYREMRKGEQLKSCLSYDKAKNLLDWNPLTHLDDGLDKTYCWFLKERNSQAVR